MSDEQWAYDEEGAWKISEQTVQAREDGSAQVETRLDDEVRDSRVGAKPSLSQLPIQCYNVDSYP